MASPDGTDHTWQVDAHGTDAAFVAALIAHLEAARCVDEQRIYLAGFSAGAAFTLVYSCQHESQVAAMATVAVEFQLGCIPPHPADAFHGRPSTRRSPRQRSRPKSCLAPRRGRARRPMLNMRRLGSPRPLLGHAYRHRHRSQVTRQGCGPAAWLAPRRGPLPHRRRRPHRPRAAADDAAAVPTTPPDPVRLAHPARLLRPDTGPVSRASPIGAGGAGCRLVVGPGGQVDPGQQQFARRLEALGELDGAGPPNSSQGRVVRRSVSSSIHWRSARPSGLTARCRGQALASSPSQADSIDSAVLPRDWDNQSPS